MSWQPIPVYLVRCPVCMATINQCCTIRDGQQAYHPARYELAKTGKCATTAERNAMRAKYGLPPLP